MELNTTTFLLEIINFLVLIWILQRFLYKPVRDIIARRQAAIQQTVSDTEALRGEAEDLKQRYLSRLEAWEQEKQAARRNLKEELDGERERAVAAIREELAEERERAEALEERRRADCLREYQRICLEQGARFVAGLLSELTGPELEGRVFRMALERMATLPAGTVDGIRLACETSLEEANVLTAYPLPAADRAELADRLGQVLGMPVVCRFREDPSLIAGLSVSFGPWVFQANLRDELRAFVDAADDIV